MKLLIIYGSTYIYIALESIERTKIILGILMHIFVEMILIM